MEGSIDEKLLAKAGVSARLRRDLDLRTSVLVLPIIAIFIHFEDRFVILTVNEPQKNGTRDSSQVP